MKACLIRNYKYNEEVVTVALNEECKKVPYVLGRLFAVLEDLQEKANPGINSTIITYQDKTIYSTKNIVTENLKDIILSIIKSHNVNSYNTKALSKSSAVQ